MRVLKAAVFLFLGILMGCVPTLYKDFPEGCGEHTVAVIVEPGLDDSIRSSLSRFEADLCTAGYNTVEHTDGFATPSALRSYLQDLYGEPGRNLAGAILIGDLPYAYQWVTLYAADPSSEEVISFQYYSDLNGIFAKSDGYTSPGGHEHSYDLHSGDLQWEIWVGVLPPYKGNATRTINGLNRYFDKNHDFRTRQLQRPEVFLQISELHHAGTPVEHDDILMFLKTGQYSWTPFSNAPDARIYFDSLSMGMSVDQGYTDMQNGEADFTVTDSHGTWAASGDLTMEMVETNPVRTLFFWSNGCAVGDLDHEENFLSSILYSPTSDVLIAKGTTNNSGGMGTNTHGFFGHNIATALDDGAPYGNAILSHVNVPLVYPWSESREFHVGTTVILGDPTLRRSNDWWEQATYALDCTSRPEGTVCVQYNDGYIWLVGDSISSWESNGAIQTAVGLTARYEHILGTDYVRIHH